MGAVSFPTRIALAAGGCRTIDSGVSRPLTTVQNTGTESERLRRNDDCARGCRETLETGDARTRRDGVTRSELLNRDALLADRVADLAGSEAQEARGFRLDPA